MQGNSSLAVDLDEIWGTEGPFAFSIWMQQESDPGDLFQYLVSTRSNASGESIDQLSDVYQPNEVSLPSLTQNKMKHSDNAEAGELLRILPLIACKQDQ